jgi:membrane-associated phospholipid phosphatase
MARATSRPSTELTSVARPAAITLDPAHPGLRCVVALLWVLGGLWAHEYVQSLREPVILVEGALERSIPFVPWAIWIYLLFFAVVGFTALRVESALLVRFLSATSIAALSAWAIVLAFPVSFERPNPASIGSDWYARIYNLIHAADPAHITFPSLHVAVTWICLAMLRGLPGRGWLIALGVAISASTLLTKQHLVSDVVGGFALAAASLWATGKLDWQNKRDRC